MIGSGNLATQLTQALKAAGQDIVQVYSPTAAHARELAEKLGCGYTTQVENIRHDADVYLIAVKDDAIAKTAAAIATHISPFLRPFSSKRPEVERTLHPSPILIHTAGSVPMSVLSTATAHYGVLYPMQTFSKNRRVDFKPIPCFIEASDVQTLNTIRTLAESVSDHVVEADSERRKKLHLAAVLACNLTNHCYRLAERVLEEEQTDFKLYLPLILETAHKVEQLSPREAQTGPMVRYDTGVMAMQMALLSDERTKEIYRLMAESIHQDYARK